MEHMGYKRDEWEFEYTASKLVEGATAQRDFRQGRAAWWRAQKEKVMQEIRESGVEITESIAAGLAYGQSNSMGTSAHFGPQVSIRQDLAKKLTECHQKIEGHTHAAAEYDGWVQVLSANAEARLKLTQADWLFFFGKV